MPFSSKVANDLLWTPFDNKSINSYGLFNTVKDEEFLFDCFSEPIFNNSSISQDGGVLFSDCPDTSEDIERKIKNDEQKYNIFTDWLESFDNDKVYTLSGNSGTGKTTFLHHLKDVYTEYEWVILDVSSSPERFDWLGDIHTVVKNYERATRKTLTAIIQEIHRIIFDECSEGNKLLYIHNNLLNIVKNYNSNFKDKYIAGDSLIKQISTVFETENDTKLRVEKCAKAFSEYFAEQSIDDYLLLDKAMDVLLLILRCNNTDPTRRFIVVFDNFERFVTQDEIYNNEINQIRKRLAVYNIRINKANNHNFKIKFIMAIRCATARLCGIKLHPADENPSNLDISSWFSIDDIIDRKIDFYKKKSITNENFELVQRIAGDLRMCANGDLTGLQLFLSPLFNDNKRLLIDFLGIIIEDLDNNEKFDYVNNLDKYKKNWAIDTDISKCAARNIIKGIVLYKLKNIDDLFKHMKVVNEIGKNKIDLGAGLARRILTIVYNKSLNSNNEIALNEVLQELYATDNISQKWRSRNYKGRRKDISEILFHMASYNRRDNDWIQFIDLQYDAIDKKLRIKDTNEMETLLYNDLENFKITIMPAGVVYLKYIVASFEFFSVRYTKDYQPLFSTVPTIQEMEKTSTKKIEGLKCLKLITRVKEKTFECMDNIKDHNLRIQIKKGYFTHQERIINYHCFYLNNLILYIQELYINNSEVSQSNKEKYQILIDNIISIRNDYKKYKKGKSCV